MVIRINKVPVFVTAWQHGPRHILKLLFQEKSQTANNSATTEAREKAQISDP
jgi:hypothetical protein